MAISITRYSGTNYARVSNAVVDLVPPSVVMLRLKRAAQGEERSSATPWEASRAVQGLSTAPEENREETPEASLLWAVLAQVLDDLALISREHLNADQLYSIRSARLHANIGALWYCKFLGIEPEEVRRILSECGYLPPITWRIVSKERVERWGLRKAIRESRRVANVTRREDAIGSIPNIERLLSKSENARL